jgi:hypothetical protein
MNLRVNLVFIYVLMPKNNKCSPMQLGFPNVKRSNLWMGETLYTLVVELIMIHNEHSLRP